MSKKLFLDLDDVLFDCSSAIAKYHKMPNPYNDPENYGSREVHEMFGMSWKEVWMHLPMSFWANLPKLPWAEALVTIGREIFGEHVYFLTAPIYTAECYGGKMLSIQKNWPHLLHNLFIGKKKQSALDRDSILVDDSQNNMDKFAEESKSENFLLFPAPSNSLHEDFFKFKENPEYFVKYMYSRLKEFYDRP